MNRRDFSVCIEMLFVPESPDFAERIRLAGAAGFEAVEFWNRKGKDLDGMAKVARAAGVSIASFVLEHEGTLADPAGHASFLAGAAEARDAAVKLGATMLIVVPGNAVPGVPREQQRAAIVTALRGVADVMRGSGVTVVLEPVNTGERPSTFVSSTREGLDIVDAVGRPEVRLLYDMYHSAFMGEALTDVLAGRVDRVMHVHLSDNPGRHEPGTGTLPWREGLAWLRANGYRGRVGLEYRPQGATVAGLGFLDVT